MSELSPEQQFCQFLSQYTVRLVGVNDKGYPIDCTGSGLLWVANNQLTLLSVYHNFKEGKRFIETNLRDSRGTILLEIPSPGYVGELSLSLAGTLSEPRDTDFAWSHFDLAHLKNLPLPPQFSIADLKLNAFKGCFDRLPSTEHVYGFAARIAANYHPFSRELALREVFELYMEFDGVQATGDYAGSYRFKVARQHQGNKYYKGSSGAPIIDEEKSIVALVRGGDENNAIVYGCPILPYTRYVNL